MVTLQVLAVHVDPVQDVFGTADFTLWDWALVTAVASSLWWIDAARKAILRRHQRRRP